MEIHRTRAALHTRWTKKYHFSSSYASVTLRGILPKNIAEASKKNNFQKKFIKNYLFVEEICHFQEQKTVKFPPKSGIFPKGNQWKSIFEIFNLHWFPFENVPDFGRNFTVFCSQKWYISSTNKYFLINFFLKGILFWRFIVIFMQNPT